jgi:tRNA 2-selenouridine synthase
VGITKLNIEEFFGKNLNCPILDVRSPSEYKHAHIPGAISFPLFSDEERKKIGTAYKQESRELAIKIGLDAFGPKMRAMVEEAEAILTKNKNAGREVRMHCWRGGMRSAAVAWLLDLYGYKVYLLAGGYKAYRKKVLSFFEKEYPLLIVGGYTGGNKTGVLHELDKKGERVLDLEKLAGHMGSAFGNLSNIPQPSQEHFENLLAEELGEFSGTDNPIWVEGESQRLGDVNLPLPFFRLMRRSTLLFLEIPFHERLKHIVTGYGKYNKEVLINATIRIKKRLGGLETKNVVNFLLEDDVMNAFAILLKYYDRLYLKSTMNTDAGERQIIYVESDTTDQAVNSKKLLNYAYSKQH